jgi:hypothetical protein
VESDPANVFCAGCLDFLFQVDVHFASPQNITRVTEAGFSAYQTDVGYDVLSLGDLVLCGIDDGGFCNSGDPNSAPSSVDRSSTGDVVGFNFPGLGVSYADQGTVDIAIETDALTYSDPLATVYDGKGDFGTALIYGPSGPPSSPSVPEPPSVLLFSTGLLGLAGAVIYRKRVA